MTIRHILYDLSHLPYLVFFLTEFLLVIVGVHQSLRCSLGPWIQERIFFYVILPLF